MSFASWLKTRKPPAKRGNVRQRTKTLRLEVLEDRLAPATFMVLNNDDGDAGSLRQAILDANANPGADLIAFDIGGGGVQSIAPTSGLPAITDPVTIDGTTQPGFDGSPIIELNGASAGFADGLVITAGNSTVRGLVINRFQFDTVHRVGGNGMVLSTNGGNVIEGNYVGTDVSGTAGLGNRRFGVLIFSGSSANRVGTNGDGINDAAERNVISGNGIIGNTSSGVGVLILGVGTNDNVVTGNYLGTDVTGTVAVGNTFRGAQISRGAQGNRIGTDGNGVADAAERNVISGNLGPGVTIAEEGTDNNTVAGNYIGTDAAGTAPLGNGRFGVNIVQGAQGNQVGGATDTLRNVIAFNGLSGVAVFHDPDTSTTVTTANRIEGNVIHSNVEHGVLLQGVSGNFVLGNKLKHNGLDGISLMNADDNLIEKNRSRHNGRDGIRADADSSGNTINRNKMKHNAEHDCHDDSVGSGTAGTSNFWTENKGKTENVPGLCMGGGHDDDNDDDDDEDGDDD